MNMDQLVEDCSKIRINDPRDHQGRPVCRAKGGRLGCLISKVLAVDFAVHIRIYAEDFKERPKEISSSQLTMAVGHAPMSAESWLKTQVLVGREAAGEDELAGYRLYMGG